MATIIDALIVTLGLDPSGFDEGRKKVEKDFKSTKDAAEATAKEVEVSGKKAAEFFSAMKTEALGFIGAIAGATGLTDMVAKTVRMDAAVGRLAGNLGMATEDLSAWEGVARRSGATAGDADTAFSSLFATLNNWNRGGGDPDKIAALNYLGVPLEDLRDAQKVLLDLAQTSEKMRRSDFFYYARQAGLSDGMINTLVQGRQRVEELLAAQKRLGVVTDDDAEKAQKIQAAFGDASTAVGTLARHLTSDATPAILGLLELAKQLAAVIEKAADALEKVRYKGDHTRKAQEALAAGDWKGVASAAWGQITDYWSDVFHGRNPYASSGDGSKITGTSKPSASKVRPSASEIRARLRSGGLSQAQSDGVIAGIYAESGLDPTATNRKSGAFGLGQWLGDRQTELFRRYGRNPTWQNQIDYLIWEIKGGDRGGASVAGATTSDAAMRAYITRFMRPAAGYETDSDIRRALSYLRTQRHLDGGHGRSVGPQVTISNINITASANDSRSIAGDIRKSLQREMAILTNRGAG